MSKKTAVKVNRKASAKLERIAAQIKGFQETPLAQVLEDELWDQLDIATEQLGFAAEDLRRAGL